MRDGKLLDVRDDGGHFRLRAKLSPVHLPANRAAAWLLCCLTFALAATTGCHVRVDKSEDGNNVKVATPFGSIAVNKDQASAAEVGLPTYPGANLEKGGDGNDSARIDMGFGSWKLRVRIADYTTPDGREQVLAFYRRALGAYGAVIECAGKRTVGTPARTGEGLTCEDSDSHGHSGSHGTTDGDEVELKAGSPRHQHLVAIKNTESSPTHFTLIALDLPHGDTEQRGTN